MRLPRQAPAGVDVHSSPWSSAAPDAPAEADLPDLLVGEDNRDLRDFICRVLA